VNYCLIRGVILNARVFTSGRRDLGRHGLEGWARAKEKKAELVTGDPEFKPLDQEIKIHWLK
jgi:hypothetical protein